MTAPAAGPAHAHEPWDKPCDETCPGYPGPVAGSLADVLTVIRASQNVAGKILATGERLPVADTRAVVGDAVRLAAALEAVLAEHVPFAVPGATYDLCVRCCDREPGAGRHSLRWPCPTVEAMESALRDAQGRQT